MSRMLKLLRSRGNASLRLSLATATTLTKEIQKFLSQTRRKECHEMYGLVILPDGYERQKRLIQNIERTLKLGKEKLTWAAVAEKDCYVRVRRTGGTEVRRFPRCFFCQRNEQKN